MNTNKMTEEKQTQRVYEVSAYLSEETDLMGPGPRRIVGYSMGDPEMIRKSYESISGYYAVRVKESGIIRMFKSPELEVAA